jgi:hypothetical protein
MNLNLKKRFGIRIASPFREGRSAPVPGRSNLRAGWRREVVQRCGWFLALLRPGTGALLVLAILLGGLPLRAQDTNAAPQLNDLLEAAGLLQTNDVAEPDNAAQADGLSSTNGSAQTNSPGQPSNREGRSRRSWRQRQDSLGGSGAGSAASNGGAAAAAANGTNGTTSLDYAAFKIVADRNIFNPNRQYYRPGAPRPKPNSVDSFSLVGIMSYEKGTFAFFDGSGSEYRKALKMNDSIAGYQLTAIEPNAVKLAMQTNELELRVGMQMRREDEGPWLAASQPENLTTSVSSTTTNSTPDTATSGADSEILKKLMQRREQE